MAQVIIDSGDLPSARGKKDGELDYVIGKWQKIARSKFQDSAELLLPMLQEIDDLRIWEYYWDGMFPTREEFLANKILIDFDLVESTIPEILSRLKRGESVQLKPHGGDRKSEKIKVPNGTLIENQGNNITLISTRGTSETYTVARLKRDNPELAQKVINGELSPNAAAIQAGFRKKMLQVPDNLDGAIEKLEQHFGIKVQVVGIKM
jgi:hypothetical protein